IDLVVISSIELGIFLSDLLEKRGLIRGDLQLITLENPVWFPGIASGTVFTERSCHPFCFPLHVPQVNVEIHGHRVARLLVFGNVRTRVALAGGTGFRSPLIWCGY